mmetsp:Transcript_53708/g.112077  ORF Transcript_53708/g.112077 Transcript_53708/m.112077 type:complete len:216 (+) Transcript_53708:1593-2240(+)
MKFFRRAKIWREILIASITTLRPSWVSTMSAAARAASVDPCTAIPTSARFSAGASLTPSPVIAAVSPGPPSDSGSWSRPTISRLCIGSVREKSFAARTAARFSAGPIELNSRPVKDRPAASSSGSKRPIMRQMVSAVWGLSPVMTMTRIPAPLHLAMAAFTSSRGGSRMPVTPMKVRSLSTSSNFLGSARRGSEADSGRSSTACARHRSACRPEA